jgi:hypothetical protein
MNIETDRAVEIDERNRNTTMAQPFQPPVEQAYAVPVEPATTVHATTTHTVHTSRFTASVVVSGVVAIGLLLLGGITVARAGLDGSLDTPVVTVAGFTATALLGLIELGFGVVLLIAALTRSEQAILFTGIAGGVAALVAVFQSDLGHGSLMIERAFAVWAAVVMAAIVVSALIPTIMRRSARSTTTVD